MVNFQERKQVGQSIIEKIEKKSMKIFPTPKLINQN